VAKKKSNYWKPDTKTPGRREKNRTLPWPPRQAGDHQTVPRPKRSLSGTKGKVGCLLKKTVEQHILPPKEKSRPGKKAPTKEARSVAGLPRVGQVLVTPGRRLTGKEKTTIGWTFNDHPRRRPTRSLSTKSRSPGSLPGVGVLGRGEPPTKRKSSIWWWRRRGDQAQPPGVVPPNKGVTPDRS